jgi:hypothetical protein
MINNRPIKPPEPLDPQALQKRYLQGQQNQITGNRVYNGISSSPHAGGGLDRSGFQQRDQQAQAKRDFLMKQMRSGGF